MVAKEKKETSSSYAMTTTRKAKGGQSQLNPEEIALPFASSSSPVSDPSKENGTRNESIDHAGELKKKKGSIIKRMFSPNKTTRNTSNAKKKKNISATNSSNNNKSNMTVNINGNSKEMDKKYAHSEKKSNPVLCRTGIRPHNIYDNDEDENEKVQPVSLFNASSSYSQSQSHSYSRSHSYSQSRSQSDSGLDDDIMEESYTQSNSDSNLGSITGEDLPKSKTKSKTKSKLQRDQRQHKPTSKNELYVATNDKDTPSSSTTSRQLSSPTLPSQPQSNFLSPGSNGTCNDNKNLKEGNEDGSTQYESISGSTNTNTNTHTSTVTSTEGDSVTLTDNDTYDDDNTLISTLDDVQSNGCVGVNVGEAFGTTIGGIVDSFQIMSCDPIAVNATSNSKVPVPNPDTVAVNTINSSNKRENATNIDVHTIGVIPTNPRESNTSRSSPATDATTTTISTIVPLQPSTRDHKQKKSNQLVLTRSALSRPFGRTSLPSHFAKRYLVEVSSPIFDTVEKRWKYPILVQKEDYDTLQYPNTASISSPSSEHQRRERLLQRRRQHSLSPTRYPSSTHKNGVESTLPFPTANISRSLQDFLWLEQALHAEYQGALLLPLLSLTLASGNDWTTATMTTTTATGVNGNTTTTTIDREQFQRGEWDPVLASQKALNKVLDEKQVVEEKLLGDWLSDILNFVRGKGEVILGLGLNRMSRVIEMEGRTNGDGSSDWNDLLSSEAMETFLYQNTDPLPEPLRDGVGPHSVGMGVTGGAMNMNIPCSGDGDAERDSCLGMNFSHPLLMKPMNYNQYSSSATVDTSVFKGFLATNLACFNLIPKCTSSTEICGDERIIGDDDEIGGMNSKKIGSTMPSYTQSDVLTSCGKGFECHKQTNDANDMNKQQTKPEEGYNFSQSESIISRRVKTYERYLQHPCSLNFPISSKAIEAHRCVVMAQREYTLRAMYRLRILLEQEMLLSAAWKRFAISLSNLFAFEKDIENSKVGGTKGSKSTSSGSSNTINDSDNRGGSDGGMKRLSKNLVDDNLRILARQKVDRAVPSLKVLSGMLSVYFADFSAIEPSLQTYSHGIQHLELLESGRITYSLNADGTVTQNYKSWFPLLNPFPNQIISGNPFNVSTSKPNSTIATALGRGGDVSHKATTNAIKRRTKSNEELLKSSLTMLTKSTNIRVARMAWKFFKMESGQASLLSSAAFSFRSKLGPDKCLKKVHGHDDKSDSEKELDLVRKFLDLGTKKKYKFKPLRSSSAASYTGSETSDRDSELSGSLMEGGESDCEDEALTTSPLVEKALHLCIQRSGRWDAELALTIMEAAGVSDAEVRVDETTRDLRVVRKLAIGLRESVERCKDAVQMLLDTVVGNEYNNNHDKPNASQDQSIESDAGDQVREKMQVTKVRENFLSALAIVFSGAFNALNTNTNKQQLNRRSLIETLSSIDIDISDLAGWSKAVDLLEDNAKNLKPFTSVTLQGKCGEAAVAYQRVRESGTPLLLTRTAQLLKEYENRIQGIESFVFVHCVGIQLEKHFSKLRAQALAAWEKKTDITTAINIATKKRLPLLVNELKSKLDSIDPSVSHTSVKEAKERHLASKALKAALEKLACRRFQRLKESSTERVVAIMKLWAHHEESVAALEQKTLVEAIKEIERNVNEDMIDADGGAHLFALPKQRSTVSSQESKYSQRTKITVSTNECSYSTTGSPTGLSLLVSPDMSTPKSRSNNRRRSPGFD